MGAKMTPTMKKRGRTVFGVKMGLSPCRQLLVRGLLAPCTHTAMPSGAAAETRYLQVHQRCLSARPAAAMLPRLLGGRLLFVFLLSSRFGSWLEMESLASICCVCDIVGCLRAVPRRRAWVQVLRCSFADGDDVARGRGGPNVTGRRAPFPN
jgi:hypothetical protein